MKNYVGLVKFDPGNLEKLDGDIWKILREHRVHHQAVNTERLYLSRSELCRGLSNALHKGKRILLAMYELFEKRK